MACSHSYYCPASSFGSVRREVALRNAILARAPTHLVDTITGVALTEAAMWILESHAELWPLNFGSDRGSFVGVELFVGAVEGGLATAWLLPPVALTRLLTV